METAEKPGVFSKLSPDDLEALTRFIDQHIEESMKSNASWRRLDVASVSSELIQETLDSITAKTGATPETAMEMALTLYEVAIDAAKQGQRVVLVDKDYRFVREVTGLLQARPDAREKVAG